MCQRLFAKNGRCKRNDLNQLNDALHAGMHFEQIGKHRKITARTCSLSQASIPETKLLIVLANTFFPFFDGPGPEGGPPSVHFEQHGPQRLVVRFWPGVDVAQHVENGLRESVKDRQGVWINVPLLPVLETLLKLGILWRVDMRVLVVSVQVERPGPPDRWWCLNECAACLFHRRDPSRM